MSPTLYHGDCIEVMRSMADKSIDAIVTDPPYELGFMGKDWDKSGIANDPAMWAECLRVLKPGGHLLAFSGSRTYHRMTCAIEDAGFEVRDQIMWLYGSGFPKSLDVSRAIDKAAGAEREVIGRNPNYRDAENNAEHHARWNGASMAGDISAPSTEDARQWQGWGTALKPAHEPICVARKPLIGTVAENVLAHGTGALNIDGCRVGTETRTNASKAGADRNGFVDGFVGGTVSQMHDHGRWPANVIHDGSDEVVALFPANAGASAPVKGTEASVASTGNVTGKRDRVEGAFHGDKGSAARFFYCAKASKKDRDDGLDHLPEMKSSVGGNRPGGDFNEGPGKTPGVRRNHHPTVKPIDLMRYLVRLVTPPGGLVLDPFMGSGSTGKAAVLEGFEFVGIDMTAEYVEIARARINYCTQICQLEPDLFDEVAA